MHTALMEDIQKLIAAMLDEPGMTQVKLAKIIAVPKKGHEKGLRVDQAQISRWKKGQQPEGPAYARIIEVARQRNALVQPPRNHEADVALDDGPAIVTASRPGDIMPDGEKIEIDQLPPDQAKKAHAMLSVYGNAEIWRLNTGVIAGLGCLPGTLLIVDLGARPRARDIVLAEYNNMPIFRQFAPPLLLGSPVDVADWVDVLSTVGHDAALIRGVVITTI